MAFFTAILWIIFIPSTFILSTLSLFHFLLHWASQRSITGKPKEWWSAQAIFERRKGVINLTAPALVAYIATVLAGFGTADLAANWPGWIGLNEAPGSWLILLGAFMITGILLGLVTRKPDRPWDLVQTLDALLLSIEAAKGIATHSTIDQWYTRLTEIEDDLATHRKIAKQAQATWAVPQASVAHRPNPLTGKTKTQSGEGPTTRPTWLNVAAWIKARKWRGVLPVSQGILTLAWLTLAILWPAHRGYAFTALFSILTVASLLGLWLSLLSVRLHLIFQSRVATEDDVLRGRIIEEVGHAEELIAASVDKFDTRQQNESIQRIEASLKAIEGSIRELIAQQGLDPPPSRRRRWWRPA